MNKKDISYELECYVIKRGGKIEIHHTDNRGFPAPGQLGDPMYVHPAKLTIYKSPAERIKEMGIEI